MHSLLIRCPFLYKTFNIMFVAKGPDFFCGSTVKAFVLSKRGSPLVLMSPTEHNPVDEGHLFKNLA